MQAEPQSPCAAETVADRSSKINSKLQSRRDHIDELNAVRMLLVKLQVTSLREPMPCWQ